MLDLVIIDGKARGIIARNLLPVKLKDILLMQLFLQQEDMGPSIICPHWLLIQMPQQPGKHIRKELFLQIPSFIQIHPTCVPQLNQFQSKLTLMSESLRNDGRIWVPKIKGDKRPANSIPEEERDYYLERRYPAFGNLVPRDVASRAAKERCDAGYGVGKTGLAVNLDFRDAIKKQGKKAIENKYGNLFEMYKDHYRHRSIR